MFLYSGSDYEANRIHRGTSNQNTGITGKIERIVLKKGRKMAELINMQQTEYDEILAELTALHVMERESIQTISNNIRALCEKEGGFYIERISSKINLMLNCVESSILAGLTESFAASESAMQTFMSSVKETDRG